MPSMSHYYNQSDYKNYKKAIPGIARGLILSLLFICFIINK